MNLFNDYNGALHRIRAKLYPNYLSDIEGRYIAKTDSEAYLTIDQVCETLKKRAGYPGNYEHLTEATKNVLDEVAYQLCDGYGVNMVYFSIHPNIGGTFNSVNEVHDPKKNKVNFKFRILKPLRDLARHITVDIVGLADNNAYIDEYIDTEEKSVNDLFLPGDMFVITGNKIKVDGDSPDCGVFFVPVDDPTKAVKVARISENTPSKVTGIAPNTNYIRNRIEIRTRFSSQNILLKSTRVIASNFILESA